MVNLNLYKKNDSFMQLKRFESHSYEDLADITFFAIYIRIFLGKI